MSAFSRVPATGGDRGGRLSPSAGTGAGGGACLVLFPPWSRILEIYISTLPDVPYRLLWMIHAGGIALYESARQEYIAEHDRIVSGNA